MAKEMMIVFVFDTSRCCQEEDDPAEAVMYFHPAWVSPTQRLALAGQLMGICQFLTSCFSPPRSISLQGGKFVFKQFGQFILAIGTDRNIHDWILERRADTLESILKFFHCDLVKISESLNNDRNKFTEKLYQMFETYLPILQYSANLFSNIPTIKLPKSASNIFLESIQVLQYCQEKNGILGGALFYNNKVVATQLGADLTKHIIIMDPYRIRAPAERIATEFHLPLGIQLLRVYVHEKEYANLAQEANDGRGYDSYLDSMSKRAPQKKSSRKNNVKEVSASVTKRDTSKIFTVPEEGELESLPCEATYVPISTHSTQPTNVVIQQEKRGIFVTPSTAVTPTVCSTPLTDVNRVLHGAAVSICSTGQGTIEKEEKANVDDIPDVVKEALRCKRLNKLKNSANKTVEQKRDTNVRRSSSLSDLENIQSIVESSERNKNIFKTITDPCYPVFRPDGLPVSQSLYEECISLQYQNLQDNASSYVNSGNWLKNLSIRPLSVTSGGTEPDPLKTNHSSEEESQNECIRAVDEDAERKKRQESSRRSMSLPLKPLDVSSTEESSCDLLHRRKLDGLQLTPLMSKLTLLADERNGTFCSRETTPSEFRDLFGFSATTNQLLRQKLDAANNEITEERSQNERDDDIVTITKDENVLQPLELFLCGHQNMVLVLLMEVGTSNDPELIHSLWSICVQTLGRLESQLQQCLDPLPSSENKELYSVLSVDPNWDTTHRSGLWGITELDIVSCLHERFQRTSNLIDITVRTEDSVVYGNRCAKTEVFYQQAIPPNRSGGLPTPADLMGTVSLKAKRRLERDHGILLL